MSLFKRGDIWWYKFLFAGQPIRESSKSTSKTVAKVAEQNRRRELEQGFNNVTMADTRKERVRTFGDVADAFYEDYAVRLPNSATYAEYAIIHLKRLLGTKMVVEVDEQTFSSYQTDRLKEGAAAKTINEETNMLLRILGDPGDVLRVRLKKKKKLKLVTETYIGKAYQAPEKTRMFDAASVSKSPAIFMALTLAQNGGMRDAEIKKIQLFRINLQKRFIQVGKAKSRGGTGRIVPLNTDAYEALVEYLRWYMARFGDPQPEWYLFPFGKPTPQDPTRHVTTFKTAWGTVRKNAKVKGRWHDNRHTMITDLAESGAGDQTIMDIAGHVSPAMLKHYSHIRMEAKRRAVESIVDRRKEEAKAEEETDSMQSGFWLPETLKQVSELPSIDQDFEGVRAQNWAQSSENSPHRGTIRSRKLLQGNGSAGRTRTYNPSVNSRMLCH
jgi:integrase